MNNESETSTNEPEVDNIALPTRPEEAVMDEADRLYAGFTEEEVTVHVLQRLTQLENAFVHLLQSLQAPENAQMDLFEEKEQENKEKT